MKQQLSPLLVVIACAFAILLVALRSPIDTFDKISVHEFELVDNYGKQRVSIKVEESGEVLLRLKDQNGAIRIKLGANKDGSGLLLLDSNTNSGIHALAKKGASLTVTDKDGNKKTY
ncbi:MAG TPA: hypothetical protein VFN30_13405 [Chitinophagaceae bacterium]|nr:hypothetical protein [Chitinophagaceae bacterium]